jgi:hypothetical protein
VGLISMTIHWMTPRDDFVSGVSPRWGHGGIRGTAPRLPLSRRSNRLRGEPFRRGKGVILLLYPGGSNQGIAPSQGQILRCLTFDGNVFEQSGCC